MDFDAGHDCGAVWFGRTEKKMCSDFGLCYESCDIWPYINKVGKDINAFSFVFWTEISNYYQCFPKGKVELVFLSRKKKMELVTYSMTPKMAFSILFDALQYY